MQFALDQQNPLVAGTVSGERSAPLPGDRFRFFNTPDPDILLWSLKPGEEGGTILRFWNMGESASPIFTTDKPPISAYSATHVETLLEPIEFSRNGFKGDFRQQQMCTFKLYW
jgi:hypothetical protein